MSDAIHARNELAVAAIRTPDFQREIARLHGVISEHLVARIGLRIYT